MKNEQKTRDAPEEGSEFIAVIRVRGVQGVRRKTRVLLEKMRLTRKNHCILLKRTGGTIKMLHKAKDYITWGEVRPSTLELLEKKGASPYALHPPRKGFGKIKKPFPKGALGYRAQAINDLIEKMV